MVEYFDRADVRIVAEAVGGREFDSRGRIFTNGENFRTVKHDGGNAAADVVPCCVGGWTGAGAPDGGWGGVEKGAVCGECYGRYGEAIEYWGYLGS